MTPFSNSQRHVLTVTKYKHFPLIPETLDYPLFFIMYLKASKFSISLKCEPTHPTTQIWYLKFVSIYLKKKVVALILYTTLQYTL